MPTASRADWKLGLLERAITAVAPTWALKRSLARHALSRVRSYEAASVSRRTDGWIAGGGSANTEILSGHARIVARSRELVRNQSWASGAVSELVSSVIGTGIRAQFLNPGRRQARAVTAQRLWEEWAETTACDADGRHNLYGLQALAFRTIVEGGEVVLRRRWRRKRDGLPVPMQVQLLEGDHLDSIRDRRAPSGGGSQVIMGVQVGALGQREGYWLFRDHPGDYFTSNRALESSFVPATDVRHGFRADRIGQLRGVPWGAPCLIAVRDFVDYGDAVRLRAKIANALVGVIHDVSSPDAENPLAGIGVKQEGQLESDVRQMEPGTYMDAPEGKSVTFSRPPAPESVEEVSRVNLLEISAGFQVPYERLTGDYARFPYSAARMSELRFSRRVEAWRWNNFIPQVCDGIATWFLEAAELDGRLGQRSRPKPTWTPQRREMIEPDKEVAAIKSRIRLGITSLSEEIRSVGEDPEAVLSELREDLERLDKLGLVLDCDPRQDTARQSPAATAAGAVTAPEPPEPPEPGEEPEGQPGRPPDGGKVPEEGGDEEEPEEEEG